MQFVQMCKQTDPQNLLFVRGSQNKNKELQFNKRGPLSPALFYFLFAIKTPHFHELLWCKNNFRFAFISFCTYAEVLTGHLNKPGLHTTHTF